MVSSTTYFRYSDLSIREEEVIYSLLRNNFFVKEEEVQIEEILPTCLDINQKYPNTLIEITFPIPYHDSFFQFFTYERWNLLKKAIKEIKVRRGGKRGVLTSFRFTGFSNNLNSILIFYILSNSNQHFEMALEKIEYIIDLLPNQIGILPDNVFELYYLYKESLYKWFPFLIKTSDTDKNINTYYFENGNWLLKKRK